MDENITNITEVSNEQREEKTPLEMAQDMSDEIDKMIDKRDEKVDGARAHFVETLHVTHDKYLTGSGVMAAIDCLHDVYNKDGFTIAIMPEAQEIAQRLAEISESMAEAAEDCDLMEFDTFCDSYYDSDFASRQVIEPRDLALEVMILNLCQQVGPAAQDIMDFQNSANEEIMKAWERLDNFCQEHSLNLAEVGITVKKV